MRIRVCSLVLALLSGLVLPLRATLFVPMSVEQLTEQSQLIVRGTVVSKSCQRDDAGRIFTRIELKVAEAWKGKVGGDRLTVVQGGGVLGDRKVVVVGQVDYRVGEEVVAFLVLNQRGEAVTLGLAQGKFRVWTDPATGRKRAQNLFHGGGEEGRPGAQPQNVTTDAGPLTLDELKRQVQGGRQ
ncbi:MAG: hypothetical protein ACYDH9_20610 [Limisphaerales bacterium]